MNARIFRIVFFLLLAAASWAQTVIVDGTHEFDLRFPVNPDNWNYEGAMKQPRTINELGLDVKADQFRLVSQWQVLMSPSQSPPEIKNLETSLSWFPGPFRMSVGNQIFAWGTADGRNPTDNLNPRDYTFPKPSKLPVVSVSATYYPKDDLSVQAVFIPQPGNSVFPVDLKTKLETSGFQNVHVVPLSKIPENFIAGGRLNYQGSFADFSASYLYDFDPFFTPVITVNAGGLPTAVNLERRRIQRFGADFKTTIDRFGFWTEASYTMTGNRDTDNYSERLSRIDYTLGTDFSFGPQDTFYLNLQYTGTVIPGFDSSANVMDPTNMLRFYQRQIVGFAGSERESIIQGITWNTHWDPAWGSVIPSLTGSYSIPLGYDSSEGTRYGNLFLQPQIEFVPLDSFHIKIGANLAFAWIKKAGDTVLTLDTTTDQLGIFTPSNNVFLAVSYQWSSHLGN